MKKTVSGDFSVKEKTSDAWGWGLFLQVIGAFIFLFVPVFGWVTGPIVIFIGYRKCRYLLCSRCGSRVTKENKICPACRATFLRERK